MTTTRIATGLALLAIPLTASPAHASGSPPVKDGVSCVQKPKKRYDLGAVARHGMPIKITCTGAATFFAVPQFTAGTRQDGDVAEMFGHSLPAIASVRESSMDAAGTVTVRPRIRPFAIRIAKRYRRTKITIGLGTLREDGHLWSDPGDWSHTLLIR